MESEDRIVEHQTSRLAQADTFPEEHRAAVRAAAAAMTAEGYDVNEYAAEVESSGRGLEVHLQHDDHAAAAARSWRGDACGRCRVVEYDPRTGAVSRVLGIR